MNKLDKYFYRQNLSNSCSPYHMIKNYNNCTEQQVQNTPDPTRTDYVYQPTQNPTPQQTQVPVISEGYDQQNQNRINRKNNDSNVPLSNNNIYPGVL
jgi:hypothetical protein